MGRRKKKPAAAAVAAVDEEPPEGSAAVKEDDGGDITMGRSVEEENGGGDMAEEALEVGERRDTSPELEGEVERLKEINDVLVKESAEKRGQVVVLSARLGELEADTAALSEGQRDVLRVVLAGALVEASGAAAGMRARLDAAQESLQAAEAVAAREAEAKGEAAARLEAAVAEKDRTLELFRSKEVDAAAVSAKLDQLEAMAVDWQIKNSQLLAEGGELEKQLEETKASARHVRTQKAEVEESFKKFRKNTNKYKQNMEEKLGKKLGELKLLSSNKEQMESKIEILEAKLSVAIARTVEIESEIKTSKTELAAARTEAEKLHSEVAEVDKKDSMMEAKAIALWIKIDKMVKTKEAAAAAFEAERIQLKKTLEAMNIKVKRIQAEKDAAAAMVHHKSAESEKMTAELESLHCSMSEHHVRCKDLSVQSSCLQDDKDSVLNLLDKEKAEAGKLRLKLGELESYVSQKDHKIGVLKSEVEDKEGMMDVLSREFEQLRLRLAIAKAHHKRKIGMWTWVCPTTTVLAAASVVYATRRR
ncbi:hypothetical protein ABZP36_009678 [Zizania latifolia]